MYLPRTFYNDLGDVEAIAHEGVLHLFHLVLPNRDLVAHAVSRDGLGWQAVAPAIATGAPGDCDDDMIRTVSVTKRGEIFYMLYTATARAEAGKVERVALAISRDLYHWEKQGAVAEADPRFYEAGAARTAFRDPKPYSEDGRYYAVVCARAKEGPRFRRGCAALMVSDDLVHWQAEAPLHIPGIYDELECPQIYKIGTYYYLLGSIIEERAQRYWVSEHLRGPYLTPPDGVLMPPGSHYAGRLCRFMGRDVFACWTTCTADGPSPFGLHPNPGAPMRVVPALLDVRQRPDGSLYLCSCPAWEDYEQGAAVPIKELEPVWHTAALSLEAGADKAGVSCREGYALCLTEQPYTDFTLRGRLSVFGPRAGLAFAADDEAEGYFIVFEPALGRVRLLLHARTPEGESFVYRILQEAYGVCAPEGESFMLRRVNGEIEFSLGGRILFSTMSTALCGGRLGLHALCGRALIECAQVVLMRAPRND